MHAAFDEESESEVRTFKNWSQEGKTLEKHKFFEESKVSKLMFESNEKKDLKIYDYLKERFDFNKIYK